MPTDTHFYSHPSRASLAEATAKVVAFRLDGVTHTNIGGDCLVAPITARTVEIEAVVSGHSARPGITLRDLLASEIVDGFGALRLPDGRTLEFLTERRALFAPAITG